MTTQSDLLGMPTDLDLASGALDAVPATKWAQGLVQLIEVQEATFQRLGVDEAEAFRLARAATLAIAEFHGGRQWYLPRGDDLATALRDAEIYRRARRGNIQDLAREYQLTDQHVWRIVRQQRALHLRKIQGDLFNEGEGA
ncbi:Mor transcription activator family protein [Pseudoxanthomonas sp.]|uniref:Mor transcription activator family protein n=1 Tax=Pseudoxanthomonas sp. TaxID=1871049 RepID=UPI0025DB295E|nr:Mor transcription activator family protein [Pseudoxanthomonas sp.]